jgi:hypothetical protein
MEMRELFDALNDRGIASVVVYFSKDLHNAGSIHFKNAAGEHVLDRHAFDDLIDDVNELWSDAVISLVERERGEPLDDGTVILDILARKVSVTVLVRVTTEVGLQKRVVEEKYLEDTWPVDPPSADPPMIATVLPFVNNKGTAA